MSGYGKPEAGNSGGKGNPASPPGFAAVMARGAMPIFMALAGSSLAGEPPAVVPAPVAATRPCVYQPVMSDEEIAACRRPEPTPARGIPSAQSDAVPPPPMVARPSLPCEIKPVMTDAEIDACRRR